MEANKNERHIIFLIDTWRIGRRGGRGERKEEKVKVRRREKKRDIQRRKIGIIKRIKTKDVKKVAKRQRKNNE